MADEPTNETNPETPQAFSADGMDDAALYAEYERVRSRGQELSAKSDLSTEEAAELGELATRVTAVSDAITARESAAAAVAAQRDAFSTLPERTAPVAPQTAQEPATEPVTAPAAPEPVTVPSVSQMAAQPPQEPAQGTPSDRLSIELSSDAAAILGRNTGDGATTRELTRAALNMFGQFGRANAGRGGAAVKRSLGTFRRDRGAELTMPERPDPDAEAVVLTHARNERRLDGGSLLSSWASSVKKLSEAGTSDALTAAAGWCAPSENRYELCSLWDVDGILDLPTTTAPRGGINYTNDVSWADIWAATSFTMLSEAEVISGETKQCFPIPCPDFTDRRLDVGVTCITGSFLQSAGYPEVVSTWTDGLLTKHEYEINQAIITQILAQAGAAIVIPAQGTGAPAGSGPDTSAAASILSAVEVAAIDMRERSNMSFNRTLEVVLPRWVLAQFRADIARRNAWYSDPFALADAEIVRWFVTRGVRPQFIRGWQDAQSGLAGGPGDITAPITPITALPTTVNFLLYPAGAIVLARQDVVTLTNVYDSTNLQQNLYTALFTEEGFAPIFPCGEVRQYTANACPSGATGAQVWTSCAAAVAPAA
jgi:hypothetical protein